MSFDEATQYFVKKNVTKQCHGTCYFEASINTLNTLIKKNIGEKYEVSRIEAFKQLSILSFDNFSQFDTYHVKNFDVISGGDSRALTYYLLKTIPILTYSKSEAKRYSEDKTLTNIFKFTQSITKQYYGEVEKLSESIKSHFPDKFELISDLINQHQELTALYLSAFLEQSQQIKNGGDFDFNVILNILTTLYNKTQAFEIYKDDLSVFKSTVEKKIELSLEYSNKLRLGIENFKEPQSLPHRLKYSTIDFVINQLEDPKSFTTSMNESKIIDVLDSGQIVLFGYYHIKNIIKNSHNYPGVVILPKDHEILSFEKRVLTKTDGFHVVQMIDYFYESTTGDLFYVLKNSHGISSNNRGYIFMRADYVSAYGDRIIHFHPTEIKE